MAMLGGGLFVLFLTVLWLSKGTPAAKPDLHTIAIDPPLTVTAWPTNAPIVRSGAPSQANAPTPTAESMIPPVGIPATVLRAAQVVAAGSPNAKVIDPSEQTFIVCRSESDRWYWTAPGFFWLQTSDVRSSKPHAEIPKCSDIRWPPYDMPEVNAMRQPRANEPDQECQMPVGALDQLSGRCPDAVPEDEFTPTGMIIIGAETR